MRFRNVRRIRYRSCADCEKAKQIIDKTKYRVVSRCDVCELKLKGKDIDKAIDYLFFIIDEPIPICSC